MDEKERLEQIKNNLSLNQVESLLSDLGAHPFRQNNIIISKTICHCGESHKLFYYENTKLFRCYTECQDTFDIFQLVMKVQKTLNIDMTLPQALKYILRFFNIEDISNTDFFGETQEELEDWKLLKKYDKNNNKEDNKQIIELKHFDGSFLKNLPQPRILPWEREGITNEVIKHHNICYNPSSQGIVIPHYDIDNNLDGVYKILQKEFKIDVD